MNGLDSLASPSLMALLASVLSASLLGSVHCAGMCGPFVAVYSAAGGDHPGPGKSSIWPLHLAYHLGRALTYAGVGALGGALGSFVDWAGEAAGLAQIAALGSSLLLIAWGVSVLFPRFRVRTPWDGLLGRRLVQLKRRPPLARASMLGTLTPLLPCGWFYAFAVTAAGTGSAATGAVVMTVFWLGTVPALLGVGALVGRLSSAIRGRLPVVTGSLLIFIGVLGVVLRMSHPLDLSSPPGSSVAGESSGSAPQSGKVKCH